MRAATPAVDTTIDWLLDPACPPVQRLALKTLVRPPAGTTTIRRLERTLTGDPWVAPLLGGAWREARGGRTRVHPYSKWRGAHWRLVALAELDIGREIPGAATALAEAVDDTLAWLLSPGRSRAAKAIDGRVRMCASMEGNALLALSRLGFGDDERIATLATRLVDWQWPDGGWNCDRRPEAHHSSANETWAPIRGLAAYRQFAVDDQLRAAIDDAVARGAGFILRHRVIRSERTGEVMNPRVGWLRWPAYWHYGLLPGLLALADAGRIGDPAARDAVDAVEAKRCPDDTWQPDGRWWSQPGVRGAASTELVDWGADGEARMLSLRALQVLLAAGRDISR